jgi:hypothetical protein
VRLTLEEFSQRMDRATTPKTRAELDRLVADLPQVHFCGSPPPTFTKDGLPLP